MDVVYSIVFYDDSGDTSPQVVLFPSEEAAIDSVVSEMAKFRSLHEDTGCPQDDEVKDSLKEEGRMSFVSADGVEYSWKIARHSIAKLGLGLNAGLAPASSGRHLENAAQAGANLAAQAGRASGGAL